MIAFEVKLNGERVCISGADDLAVLNTNVSAVGKLGKETVPARTDSTTSCVIHYSVGGLTSRPDADKNVHAFWESSAPLKVGDVIENKVLETDNVDCPKSQTKAVRSFGGSRTPRA
jgi:hypothetical protein